MDIVWYQWNRFNSSESEIVLPSQYYSWQPGNHSEWSTPPTLNAFALSCYELFSSEFDFQANASRGALKVIKIFRPFWCTK